VDSGRVHSLNPWRIGDIVAAALAILHFDHAAPHDNTQQSTRCAEWLISYGPAGR